MPYSSITELPEEVRRAYGAKQQRAFREAFNQCDGDGGSESRCFRVAHAAAKRVEGGESGAPSESAREVARQRGVELARQFTAKQRERLAKDGKAMSDGSFPIENEGDLRNALQALGRASDKGAARRHIVKRARALGRTDLLPEDWGRESSDVTSPPETSSTDVQDVTRAFVTEHGGRLFLTAPGSGPRVEAGDQGSENPNFVYLQGAYVGSEKANRNGALWTTADLEMGEPTVRHGPLNWLHEDRKVLGAITEAGLVRPQPEVAAVAHPYIQTTSVMWRFLWPEESRVIENASEQSRLWLSMECISQEVECVDHGCGSFPYLDMARGKASVCEHVRERSGTRRFVDPIFLGGAVIVPPARPGWPDAHAQLMNQASQYAEAAFDQAGRPDVPAAEWESLMAAVLRYAGVEPA